MKLTIRDKEEAIRRATLVVVIIVFVVAVALQFQVSSRNKSIDDIEAIVIDLQEFTDTIEEETPDELERSQAIQRAVAQVPEIRQILCEAFPEVPACQA